MQTPLGNIRESIDNLSVSDITNTSRKIDTVMLEKGELENIKVGKRVDIVSSKLMKLLGNRMDKIVYIRKTLFLKYAYLRQLTINFQVSIIVASTIITFLESLNGHLPMSNSHVQVASIAFYLYCYFYKCHKVSQD